MMEAMTRRSGQRIFAQLALVAVTLPLAGCPLLIGPEDDEGGTGLPCEDDVVGCDDDTSKFVIDEACELTGDLELVIGQGETEFSPLAEGELPELEFGFQGGQHVWMAFQVQNPDLERPQLKIRANVDYCDANCDDQANWQTDNVRELVADESTLTTTDEGWLEQTRILVTVFAWANASNRRVELLVTDPCGRQGYAVREATVP